MTSSMLARRCGIIVSRSAMSGMSARARVTSARSTVTERIASSQSGARPRTSPLRPRHERSARKNLAAFASDEFGQRDIDAVLVGDVANQPVPAAHARRARARRRALGQAARRRRGTDEDDLRAIERGDRRRHAVPGVLAHEHRRATPWRVEGTTPRARARRIAPRRTARTSAGTPCDGRDGCAAHRRRV